MHRPAVNDDGPASDRDLVSYHFDEAHKTQLVWNTVVGPLEVMEVAQATHLLTLTQRPHAQLD